MRPVVLAVAAFTGIETIDGGDTAVVRFNAPDGREVALLIPQRAIADLKGHLFQAPLQPGPSPRDGSLV